jgi:hypothetical protein
VRVSALPKRVSDHTPLLVGTGCNLSFRKKKFMFEKWWLERADFREVVTNALSIACVTSPPLKRTVSPNQNHDGVLLPK